MTGPQHTRWLIAGRMMQVLCSHYSIQCSVGVAGWYVYFTFQKNITLSSSTLSQWSEIINKYKSIYYELSLENDYYKVKIT